MNSMTGFGQAAGELRHHRVTVTVRGVNHRNLDVVLRLRDDLRDLEPALRERIGRVARRGRVEVALDIARRADAGLWPGVERDALRQLREVMAAWTAEGLLPSPPTTGDLLRALESQAAATAHATALPWADEDRAAIVEFAARAIDEFAERRAAEGAALRRVLLDRLEELTAAVAALRRRRPQALEEAKAALDRRLADLLGGSALDPQRVAQEAAVLADRTDVQEELDRLAVHLVHARELADGEAPGRKLDFLAQEILRELNTLGGKSRDSIMVRGVLDAKVICEQFREQAQNVE